MDSLHGPSSSYKELIQKHLATLWAFSWRQDKQHQQYQTNNKTKKSNDIQTTKLCWQCSYPATSQGGQVPRGRCNESCCIRTTTTMGQRGQCMRMEYGGKIVWMNRIVHLMNCSIYLRLGDDNNHNNGNKSAWIYYAGDRDSSYDLDALWWGGVGYCNATWFLMDWIASIPNAILILQGTFFTCCNYPRFVGTSASSGWALHIPLHNSLSLMEKMMIPWICLKSANTFKVPCFIYRKDTYSIHGASISLMHLCNFCSIPTNR